MGERFGLCVGPGPDGQFLVREVSRGWPAAAAGVQPGWRLLAAYDVRGREIPLYAFVSGRGGAPLPENVSCVFQDGRGREIRMQLVAWHRAASPGARKKSAALPGSGTWAWGRGRENKQVAQPRRSRSAGGNQSSDTYPSAEGAEDPGGILAPVHPRKREPPRRFSSSPARSPSPGTPWGLTDRSRSGSPSLGSWFAAIKQAITQASLFKRQIESIEPGSHEARVACGRAWRGWTSACRDDAIIMRKEYPSECVERFRKLRRQLREDRLAGVMECWERAVKNRRAQLLCSVRILRLAIRDLQGMTFSEWARVTKNGARPQVSSCAAPRERSAPQKMEASSSLHRSSPQQSPLLPIEIASRTRDQQATLLPIEITSGTRSPSSSPPRSNPWFLGLFGKSSRPQAHERFLQEPELVCCPRLPEHVLAMWPDLDLDSYVVRRPDHLHSGQNHAIGGDVDSAAALAQKSGNRGQVAGANGQEWELNQMRNNLQQMQQLNKLILSSRERVQRLASRPGLGWLMTTRFLITLSDLQMAKNLLEGHDYNVSRALAAFTVKYVGYASYQESNMRRCRRICPAWRIVCLRERLRRHIADKMLQKVLRSRLRVVLENWKDASQNKWESDDDGLIERVISPNKADGFKQIIEFSSNAGRAVLGERGVAAGITLASALGGFFIGPSRFQAVLASMSPSPPSSPTRDAPSSPRRPSTISPPPRAWPASPAPQPRPRAMTWSPPPRRGLESPVPHRGQVGPVPHKE